MLPGVAVGDSGVKVGAIVGTLVGVGVGGEDPPNVWLTSEKSRA
jgi:hypothetical protein